MAWAEREAKVLEAILAIEEDDSDRVVSTDLAKTVGLSEAEVIRAMNALYEADYIAWSNRAGLGATKTYIVPRLLERGRRAVGQWPKDGFDELVAVLDERIRAVPEGPEKSGLERFRDAVLGMGREVVVDVLGAAIKSAGGI